MSMPYQVYLGPFIELTKPMTREEQNEFFEKFEDRVYKPEGHDTVLLPNQGDHAAFTGSKYSEPAKVYVGQDTISMRKLLMQDDYADILEHFGTSRCRVSFGVISYYA